MTVEFVAFFLATLNFRYCAKGHIAKTLVTDLLISANGFLIIKLVTDATSAWEMAGYIVGAGLGSYVAMRMTKGLQEHESESGA